MATAIISHSDCSLHDMGPGHPECPARLSAISHQLHASGFDRRLQYHEAPRASREQLQRVHGAEHVQNIFASAPGPGRMTWLDPDTAMNEHSLDAALRAAGAVVLGVDLVMQNATGNAFCSVRPPGHHAERNRSMGFCLFNNIAVGAAHGLGQYSLQRIAILDFDVHHGNGSEDIFRDDERILLCSTFRHPWYPHCGADSVSDHIVNVPLPAGTDGDGFRQAVVQNWLPKIHEFRPELIMVSAGFDAHVDDPLGGLALCEADYAWVTREICAVAAKYAQGRIVSSLEGGYALPALAASVMAHIEVMLEA